MHWIHPHKYVPSTYLSTLFWLKLLVDTHVRWMLDLEQSTYVCIDHVIIMYQPIKKTYDEKGLI